MLPRIEYSVTARTTPDKLWEAFCDLTRLLDRGIYVEAVWTSGEPWHTGSRLRYVLEKPVAATVSGVVTLAEPPHRVSLINHSLGITADQVVTFSAAANGMTKVTMTMEFVGESKELPLDTVVQAIQVVTRDALDSMLVRWRQAQVQTQP
jgi:hypothetical protein